MSQTPQKDAKGSGGSSGQPKPAAPAAKPPAPAVRPAAPAAARPAPIAARPAAPRPPAPRPPAPAAAGAAPATGNSSTGLDTIESSGRNIFVNQQKTNFTPTPLKRTQTGEVSTDKLRVPVSLSKPPPAPRSGGSGGSSSAYLMPGAPTGTDPTPKADNKTQPKPAQNTNKPGQPGARPGSPAQRPGGSAPTSPAMPSAQAARPAAKPPPKAVAQPSGLITEGDALGYQGKLPVYVGKPSDGNPMIDAEDAKFMFDPQGSRVQLEFHVASIMLKAACLHLGIPPPERGPRRFILHAKMKPSVIEEHKQQLFDGNLEVRLAAQVDGRPVLLDLTLYEEYHVTPES